MPTVLETGQIELDFDRLPSAPVDQHTADVLALMRVDPIHDRDRARIIAAILSDAVSHRGMVDPNRVRAALTDRHGDLTVNPPVVGATYHGLARKSVIVPAGWVVNNDRSGNAGKPARLYRLSSAVAA